MHILSQVELTGAEVHAVTLAEWQIQQGHEVTILSDELHMKTSAQFVPMKIHRSNRWNRWSSIFQLRKLIQQKKVHVLHAHSRAALRIAYWARLGLKCALVSTVHGRQHGSFSKRLFDLYGERVIAVCANLAKHLEQDFKMNFRKMKVIGNPLHISEDNRVESDPWKLLLMGRLTGPKGQQSMALVESVFPILLRQMPQLKIHIVGGQLSDLSSAQQIIFQEFQKQFPDRVKHDKFVDQPDQLIASSGLIIGAGRVAISAALQRRPVFVMGEFQSHGFLRSANLEEAKASNFGDIGLGLRPELNLQQTLEALKSFYQKIPESGSLTASPSLKEISEALKSSFSLEEVGPAIIEQYKAAHFKRAVPQWFPIMMYHKVVPEPLQTKHRIFVTKDTFEKHLKFYQSQGFQSLQFADLKSFWNLEKPMTEFPKKPFMITFDDGYLNNLELAVPLLQKYGFKSTVFLLADKDLKANSWDEHDGTPQLPLMNDSQRQALKKSGQEVGSHGFRHGRLQQMDEQQTENEMKGSKEALEHEFQCEVPVYAYTYGHKNSESEKWAEKSGYQFAVNTTTGGLHLSENPWSLYRVSIFPEDGVFDLWKKTRSWYRKYYFLKRHE